jgi:hypothetical protein
MSQYELLSIVFNALTVTIAALAAIFGLIQLRRLVEQVKAAVDANTLSRLDALLQMEQHLAESRSQLSKAGIKMSTFSGKEDISDTEYRPVKLEYDEAKQSYLNALDRLCYCIDRGLLDESEMRPEYRDYVTSIVREFKSEFDTGTVYRNIVKVYEKWADS